MRIKTNDIKNYVSFVASEISDGELEEMDMNGEFPWEMKRFEKSTKGGDENEVVLTALRARGYYKLNTKKMNARKVLKDCFVVEYTLNSVGSSAFFEEEEEAIDFTMKIIALIKA